MVKRRESGKQTRLRVEAHARELGFRSFAEQTAFRRMARQMGFPPKPNTTRETLQKNHPVANAFYAQQHEKQVKREVRTLPRDDSFRGLLSDSIHRNHGIDYELHGYSRSAHHVFTFASSDADWNDGTWKRIRDGLLYRASHLPRGVSAWIQASFIGYFFDYGTHNVMDNVETRSLDAIQTRVFYQRFPLPMDLAAELLCDGPQSVQLIYIEYLP